MHGFFFLFFRKKERSLELRLKELEKIREVMLPDFFYFFLI